MDKLYVFIEPDENANENEPPVLLDGHLTSRIAYHTLMGDKPNCLLKYVKRTKKQKPTPFQVEVFLSIHFILGISLSILCEESPNKSIFTSQNVTSC